LVLKKPTAQRGQIDVFKILIGFVVGVLGTSAWFLLQPLISPPPASVHISPEARQAAVDMREQMAPLMKDMIAGDANDRRAILNEHFFAPRIAVARELYPVKEEVLTIDGVYTEVFTPPAGIPPENANRVLINLHGGGFSMGARTEGRLESIPVANIAGMKVISVDYRQGPEHRFPAASEDVATVYKHLLEDYRPENIGIFGCSAGGMLTAQSAAWFDAHDLPQPGAIGIFCAGAGKFGTGDADTITRAFGVNFSTGQKMEYFEGESWDNPLIAPQEHPDLLARFPTTLLITSTRDGALSSAAITHQRLIAAGVKAELYVYEGLVHYFFADTELPESRHVFNVIADFFDRELGTGLETAGAPHE
jgi:epsilon-lactone hydrolase